MSFQAIKFCRVCGSNNLLPIISLGKQYVTNFVDNENQKVYKSPLDLVLCDPKQGGCGLLQLKHTFSHDILYKTYWFRSGMSTTLVNALADITKSGDKLIKLKNGDVVVDIGSNDGTLLSQYRKKGIIRIGFEPSNLWNIAKGDDLTIVHDYFNYQKFKNKVGNKKARLITSIAMFYDLDEPNIFVNDIKKILDNKGVWIIQMNYLYLMIKNNTFDNISHEHLEYYSLLSLEKLLERHEFEVFDVELNDVNGGSFRIYIKHKGARIKIPLGARSRVEKLKSFEKKMGLDTKRPYLKFAKEINKIKTNLHTFLQNEVNKGKNIFIYGASTRGLVILQFANIDKKLIRAAVDKNPDKWGKYIVGTGIPIISLDEYRIKKPDYLFVLPYHLIEELKVQEIQYLKSGGKMIIPIPKFKVVTKNNMNTL